MKHKPQVFSGRQIVDRIWDHEDISGFPQFIDSDGGGAKEGVCDQFFVCDWPECCVTTQSLGDATIHGPYESKSEAMSCHENAEMC
jgi:hypothetical protein